jgi:farnesyl diphosphate synthase
MCGGQALDLAATGVSIDLDSLIHLHSLKTGALLKACVNSAFYCGSQVEPEYQVKLLNFATNIGLAFQVQDDILDVTASSETLGKPSGSDQESDKSTFPSLLGLEQAKEKLHDYHQQALQALAGLPYNTQLLQQFADLMMQRKY